MVKKILGIKIYYYPVDRKGKKIKLESSHIKTETMGYSSLAYEKED